ncbi:hypothetical protein [Saccharopolyspora elongata]|uniref:hypothetical protein n=1 Tax=Saccharopolyspora elongata TaxID=2530387 RepID=UPI001404458D|nr:hypothetical protein [Saccharopolyspora elongata]
MRASRCSTTAATARRSKAGDRRELFTAADGTELHWPDGARYVARKLSAYSA